MKYKYTTLSNITGSGNFVANYNALEIVNYGPGAIRINGISFPANSSVGWSHNADEIDVTVMAYDVANNNVVVIQTFYTDAEQQDVSL